MSIIRITKQKNFSIISNIPLNDDNLSFKAKGIWAYLMSKPDDWTVYLGQLAKVSREGKDAVRSGLQELMKFGYIERKHIRNSSGQFTGYEYIVNENSTQEKNQNSKNPVLDNPTLDNPTLENPTLLKTDRIPTTDFNKTTTTATEKSPPPPPPLNKSNVKTIDELQNLLPENLQKKSIVDIITKANINNGFEYTQESIQYALNTSQKNTWQSFKSYLGKTIDENWAAGYLADEKDTARLNKQTAADKDKMFLESRRQFPSDYLKFEAAKGCRFCEQVLQEREENSKDAKI